MFSNLKRSTKNVCFLAVAFLVGIALVLTCPACMAQETVGYDGPQVRSQFIFSQSPFARCHTATIVEAPDHSLVAAWYGQEKDGSDYGDIWSSRLEYGSENWTAPQRVADSGDKALRCWNPVLYMPGKGPMLLFYKYGRSCDTWKGATTSSDDYGKTWSERKPLPDGALGPIKNKPIKLGDGTLLCPSSTENDGNRIHFEFFSPDGKWTVGPSVKMPEGAGAIQPTIFRHKDGRLQALCRNCAANGDGTLWQTWSADEGKTWSELEPTSLPNPNSGVDGVTLKDGRLLLAYNHANDVAFGRSVLNVAVSDDGINWKAVCVLFDTFATSPYAEYAYPSVIQSEDGRIHIVYTWCWMTIAYATLDPEKIIGVPIVDGVWPESIKFVKWD